MSDEDYCRVDVPVVIPYLRWPGQFVFDPLEAMIIDWTLHAST